LEPILDFKESSTRKSTPSAFSSSPSASAVKEEALHFLTLFALVDVEVDILLKVSDVARLQLPQ
jgi:predicted nucleic acid-binding OB-fold protein